MIDSTMHCTCGKYVPTPSTFSYRPIVQDVRKNCGLLPPIETPGLFIQGDTDKGDDK